jgi:hypothetical protein
LINLAGLQVIYAELQLCIVSALIVAAVVPAVFLQPTLRPEKSNPRVVWAARSKTAAPN